MAGLQQTYSGDLTSSLTGAIADVVFAIATRGKSAKTKALAYAGKYGVDTAFKPGEFTAREGRNYLIERTLGKRFVPKTSPPQYISFSNFTLDLRISTSLRYRLPSIN